MTADRAGAAITILGGMALVGSALIVRRSQFRGGGWWMAPIWVAIFAVLIVAGRWIDSQN